MFFISLFPDLKKALPTASDNEKNFISNKKRHPCLVTTILNHNLTQVEIRRAKGIFVSHKCHFIRFSTFGMS